MLEQLLVGQQAHVPVLWLYEVVSVLAKAQRTGSITVEKAHGFLEDIGSLEITVDDESFGDIFGDVHRLAVEHGLRGYDAAYLELAIRKGLPLATLDEDLAESRSGRGRRTIPASLTFRRLSPVSRRTIDFIDALASSAVASILTVSVP